MVVEFLVENAVTSIAAISASVSIGISVLYMVLVDQEEMQRMKDRVNELQNRFQEAQDEGREEEASKYHSEMMQATWEQLQMNMKPIAVSFVAIGPIFLWLFPALYGIGPVSLEDGQGTLTYKGSDIPLQLSSNTDPSLRMGEESIQGTIYGDEIRFEDRAVEAGGYRFHPTNFNRESQELQLKRVIVTLPVGLPFFGAQMGWLGWYILVSIPFGFVSRQILRP